MDLAIKFGNIDALLIKAEEWIKHGKVFNGFRAMLDAGYAISCIELSDHGDQFAEDTKKRREIISAILLKGEQNSCSESPKKAAGVQSTKFFDLDELIMKPDETFFLKDIVGLEEAKITLLQAIVLPVVDPDLVERDYRWTGILLFGTSGVGKSKILKALNNSIHKTIDKNITFINLTLDAILGAFHGETEKNLSLIFKAASLRTPMVIVFDEIDCLCSSRTNEKADSEMKMINHFLTILDTISLYTDLVVVGTTNKIDKMDGAFYRRFQIMHYVELPDQEQRGQLLESLLNKFQPTASIDFRSLAADTERFSSADLTKLVAVAVNTVRTGAVAKRVLKQMEASEKVNIKDLVFKTDYRPITEEDLRKALNRTCPTNKEEDIRRLDKFANEFCGRREKYTKIKSDLSLPTPKMVLEKPGKSCLKVANCVHQFFGQ